MATWRLLTDETLKELPKLDDEDFGEQRRHYYRVLYRDEKQGRADRIKHRAARVVFGRKLKGSIWVNIDYDWKAAFERLINERKKREIAISAKECERRQRRETMPIKERRVLICAEANAALRAYWEAKTNELIQRIQDSIEAYEERKKAE